MDSYGWISLHHKIKEHWIWANSAYLKAWIQMILDVNHESIEKIIKIYLDEKNQS